MVHAKKLGLFPKGINSHASKFPENMARGSANGNAKLIEEDVIEIRCLYATGNWTQQEIAYKFRISSSLVSYIVRRDIWQHI